MSFWYFGKTTLSDGLDEFVTFGEVDLDHVLAEDGPGLLPEGSLLEEKETGLFPVCQEKEVPTVFERKPLDIDIFHLAVAFELFIRLSLPA